MPSTADNLLSDPEIATAYEDVRSDKSETTWMVLKYISGTSDALKLDSTGQGDIAECVEHLGDDEAAYAFVRMTVGNDELSQRVKFVFVSWCGKCFSFFLSSCSWIWRLWQKLFLGKRWERCGNRKRWIDIAFIHDLFLPCVHVVKGDLIDSKTTDNQ